MNQPPLRDDGPSDLVGDTEEDAPANGQPAGPALKAWSDTAGGRPPFRGKVAAAWLAALFGVFSLHWWYLGRRHAWAATLAGALMLVFSRFYPVWWDSPPFLLLIIPISAGFIESLVLALKPDEWFDARYNPGSARHNRTGWDAVLVAIFSTFVGAMVLMFGIALIVIHVYTEMGWLEGLKL